MVSTSRILPFWMPTYELTSANAVLGFKYIFDQAEKDGKPCVVNFSNGESFAIERQRKLEGLWRENLLLHGTKRHLDGHTRCSRHHCPLA